MGTKHLGIPVPELRTPPLGGARCPDPAWASGRALILGGPDYSLGARWVLTSGIPTGVAGVPPVPPVVVPPTPPPEGSILFVDVIPDPGRQATGAPPEGSTLFVDEV